MIIIGWLCWTVAETGHVDVELLCFLSVPDGLILFDQCAFLSILFFFGVVNGCLFGCCWWCDGNSRSRVCSWIRTVRAQLSKFVDQIRLFRSFTCIEGVRQGFGEEKCDRFSSDCLSMPVGRGKSIPPTRTARSKTHLHFFHPNSQRFTTSIRLNAHLSLVGMCRFVWLLSFP